MKKKGKILLFCLLSLFTIGCRNKQELTTEKEYTPAEISTVSVPYAPANPRYQIHVVYSQKDHQLTGDLKVTFKNNLPQKMEEVYFNLWPNADIFKKSGIRIESVFREGELLSFSVKNTTLLIPHLTIEKNQEVTLEIAFTVQVPHEKGRFGWSSQQVSLGNWFPILAVYDDHGWNLHPYFEEGESFYSITGSYEVTFEVPVGTEVIASGKLIGTSESATTTLYRFEADKVRDFAAFFHIGMQTIQTTIYDTNVRVYYGEGEEEKGERILEAAESAMEAYHQKLGPYPWNVLNLVSVDLTSSFNGGMEYPQLVFINTPYLITEEELEGTVMHEVAHQWFYSAVGNDSYREPWLDEALTTYVSSVAFYGTTDLEWETSGRCMESIMSSVADFIPDNADCYEEVVYEKGAEMLGKLHDLLGTKVFWEGLRQYYQDFQFQVATTADFIHVMQEVSSKNLEPFFSSYGIFLK